MLPLQTDLSSCIQSELNRVVVPFEISARERLGSSRLLQIDSELVLRRPIETTRVAGHLASQRLPHASATNQVKGPQPIENRQEGSIGPAI